MLELIRKMRGQSTWFRLEKGPEKSAAIMLIHLGEVVVTGSGGCIRFWFVWGFDLNWFEFDREIGGELARLKLKYFGCSMLPICRLDDGARRRRLVPRYRTTSNIVLARRRANIRTSELDVLRLLFLMKAIGILVRCGILVWREGDWI